MKVKKMKKAIIYCLLMLLPAFSFGQLSPVQKMVNGKPCDTCEVKYYIFKSNNFPWAIVGGGFASELMSEANKTSRLDKSYNHKIIPTLDSVFNVAFFSKNQIVSIKNPDYKNIEIRIDINNKPFLDWKIVNDLKPDNRYKINNTEVSSDNETWGNIHQTPDIKLGYNDMAVITLRYVKTKKIYQKIPIKRILSKPTILFYYQTALSAKSIKDNLQGFLNNEVDTPALKSVKNNLVLQKNKLGVLGIEYLQQWDKIEYSFDQKSWKGFKSSFRSPFPYGSIIIDENDVPPGTTKTLYIRYADEPETTHKIEIKGIAPIAQTSWFKIGASIMLALFCFAIIYFIIKRNHKKQLLTLKNKNADIETRLSLLSGQLNPHFLFNSLHAIQGTINSQNPKLANTYISNVASFMRNVMDQSKKDFISLQEELKLEEDYLQLEQQRKTFSYTILVDENLQATMIDFPPMLLQPVLENSIRHAFNETLPNPNIKITVNKEDKDLVVKVTDNGLAWNAIAIKENHGLSLIRKRLALYAEKLPKDLPITMDIAYQQEIGTVTSFIFKNWIS
ncbi:sensor histidine kinase [Nubsella zeaxanthinifaciens]|uniref:sensor histidine kinase n=1 Tax=Nubsella zeaxanthinifaciens TaxID=392412 RepID=UPI0013005B63|nr:histidine kinase [Nubsella zeaxanthinifaciens]